MDGTKRQREACMLTDTLKRQGLCISSTLLRGPLVFVPGPLRFCLSAFSFHPEWTAALVTGLPAAWPPTTTYLSLSSPSWQPLGSLGGRTNWEWIEILSQFLRCQQSEKQPFACCWKTSLPLISSIRKCRRLPASPGPAALWLLLSCEVGPRGGRRFWKWSRKSGSGERRSH